MGGCGGAWLSSKPRTHHTVGQMLPWAPNFILFHLNSFTEHHFKSTIQCVFSPCIWAAHHRGLPSCWCPGIPSPGADHHQPNICFRTRASSGHTTQHLWPCVCSSTEQHGLWPVPAVPYVHTPCPLPQLFIHGHEAGLCLWLPGWLPRSVGFRTCTRS